MKYLEAIEQSKKINLEMDQSSVFNLLGEPDEKNADKWTYDFDKLEKWPMIQGPGQDENAFWTFREKGYVSYTKNEKYPYALKSVLEHFLGISISFKEGKVSDLEYTIGITLGRQ